MKTQAHRFNIFDNIVCVTDKDLQNDNDFWPKHSRFINSNPRGYGYWLWKPYIILKQLELLNDGDILFYADCGCELNIRGLPKMNNYISLTKKYKIIGTNTTR